MTNLTPLKVKGDYSDLVTTKEIACELALTRRALDLAAVALLDGAMKIGKQAKPIDTEIVIGRLAKIRQLEMSE